MTRADLRVSFGQRVADLAARHPDRTALHLVAADGSRATRSWRQLDEAASALARVLLDRGVGPSTMVVVAMGNVAEHLETTLAAWKIGACVLPLSPRLATRERQEMLEAVGPDRFVVTVDEPGRGDLALSSPAVREELASADRSPVATRIPHPGKAIGSGGSTGRSKVVVDPRPWAAVPGAREAVFTEIGFRPGQVQLVAGPLYHNSPFSAAHHGLFEGHTLVVMERFDAARALDLIEEHRVEFAFLAPTMMLRIARAPGFSRRDLTGLVVYHTAGPCPAWLKREWIAKVGPSHLHEAYGASENVGYTTIDGNEWLRHPGSVGRPRHCEVRVVDELGHQLPPGAVGRLYLRPSDAPAPDYRYLGSDPLPTTDDGFTTVGDLGWLDDAGYLYIADRRNDLVITGGVNVYPAEVEAALLQHPQVADAVVIGLPDPDWGRRVHAVVQPVDVSSPPAVADLESHVAEQLSPAKRPKSYELVDLVPRDESGKVRRSQLVADRSDPAEAVRT
jgi:bile acid-coenzyme A ligase